MVRRTARQRDLLDRLVALLAEEGFSQFTLDDLAVRLRCSKTTLYALAGSKQLLVVEVVKQYFRSAVPAVEARVSAAGSSADRVVAYLTAVGEYLQPLSRTFMEDLSAFPPAAEVYQPPFPFTGTIRQVSVDLGGELIADDDATVLKLMAQQ